MAVDDAYATAAEYRAATTKTDATDDASILSQLKGVSRYWDYRCNRFFTQDAAVVVRTFDGKGECELWLPADIATATGLIVKADLDGDYSFADETALVLDTDFWLGPSDADKGPEPRPWEILEVHPNSAQLSAWPCQQKALQVTAKFGWPAVPQAIKDATIALTRYMRDFQEQGMHFTLQNTDSVVSDSREMRFLLTKIESVYKRPAYS
ncbi:MAG: phage gp6-like head-tail connector protein [Anaerolineales bacterium]|nr:phage gp6-like head-tail connector protein [Anaerolineales bacterium]